MTTNNLLDATFVNRELSRDLWLRSVSLGLCKDYQGVQDGKPLLDLHDFSEGAAETAVLWWFDKMCDELGSGVGMSHEVVIVTGKSLHRHSWSSSGVRERVLGVVQEKTRHEIVRQKNAGQVHVLYFYRVPDEDPIQPSAPESLPLGALVSLVLLLRKRAEGGWPKKWGIAMAVYCRHRSPRGDKEVVEEKNEKK